MIGSLQVDAVDAVDEYAVPTCRSVHVLALWFATTLASFGLNCIVAQSVAAQSLRQVIAPFTVEAANGSAYRNPFSGGLWQPRTGLRDVDGDGRLDLFTLNPDGELRMYRNEGAFQFRRVLPSSYTDLPINSWFRFADLDGDGDGEILTAGPRSEVLVIYNAGTDAAPRFTLPPQYLTQLRVIDGAPKLDSIRTQRETVPSLVDIDADGDLDLFAGNIDGTISYYENVGTPEQASFEFRTSTFEDIQVIGAGAARKGDASDIALLSGRRHGASVLDFTDLDGDGDLDFLFGDAFTFKLLHFINDGTPRVPAFSMTRLDTAFRPTGDDVESEGFNQPVTGDIDGDGDIDAIISSLNPVASVQPLTLFENIGTRTAPVMRRRSFDLTSEIDVGTYASPALIRDANRNGFIVGSSSGRISYFAYEARSFATSYRLTESFVLPGLFQTVPSSGDLDGDGVAELVVGESNGAIIFMRFRGAALERFGDTFQLNRNASPTLVDLDSDGDLDIFAGGENGRITYFENTGSSTTANFVRSAPPPPFVGRDFGYDAAPRFYDIDADGDQDVMVGSRTGGASGQRDTIRFFLRDGNSFAETASHPPIAVARNPIPLGLDVAEGRYLLVGDLAGGIKAFEFERRGAAHDPENRSSLTARLLTNADAQQVVDVEWRGTSPVYVRIVDIRGREIHRETFALDVRNARIMLEGFGSGTYIFEALGNVGSRVERISIPVVVRR